jgi:hypothetical protein
VVYVFAGLIVIALGILALSQLQQAKALQGLLDLIGDQNQRAQDERRELINRVQFPERMPTRPQGKTGTHSTLTPEQREAFAKVGTVAPQVAADGD